MENNKTILQELREITPAVANIGNQNIYSVPNGYFENLNVEILNRINEVVIPQTESPYQVSAGYFEGIATSIIQKIQVQESGDNLSEIFNEIEAVAPLLNTISKKNIYTLPPGYFENLSKNIAVVKPGAKIISFKNTTNKWFLYAAAACVLVFISTGIYFYLENKNNQEFAIEYKNSQNLNVDNGLAGLSDEEITDYLNIQPASVDIVPATDMGGEEFQQMLHNASDDELNKYLKENKDPGKKNI